MGPLWKSFQDENCKTISIFVSKYCLDNKHLKFNTISHREQNLNLIIDQV